MVLGRKEKAWRLMSDAMRFPYPNGWFMAVADSEADAARGEALLRDAGATEVRRLVAGGDGVATLGKSGRFERLMNWLRHLNTDQAADLLVYEGARDAGRVVLVARGLRADARRAVAAELRRADLHFVNFYGGVVTEDWDGWRGEILPNVPKWVWR
jgi:hypothetical protein